MRHVLKLCAALALLATPAAAQRISLDADVVQIIRRAHEHGPYRSWDELRMAMPREVRWHLVPPDREDAQGYRRSGWFERDGVQGGVAACGSRGAPELLTLRVGAGSGHYHRDRVIEALSAEIEVRQRDHEPTMIGEVDRYELRAGAAAPALLVRELDCPMEGSRGMRSCDVHYSLDLRPDTSERREPPHACRAP